MSASIAEGALSCRFEPQGMKSVYIYTQLLNISFFCNIIPKQKGVLLLLEYFDKYLLIFLFFKALFYTFFFTVVYVSLMQSEWIQFSEGIHT